MNRPEVFKKAVYGNYREALRRHVAVKQKLDIGDDAHFVRTEAHGARLIDAKSIVFSSDHLITGKLTTDEAALVVSRSSA